VELLKNYSVIAAIASAAAIVLITTFGFVVPSLRQRLKIASVGLIVFSLSLFVGDIALDAFTGKKLSAYVAQPIFRSFCKFRPNEDCLRRISENPDSKIDESFKDLTETLGDVRAELAQIQRLKREILGADNAEAEEETIDYSSYSFAEIQEAAAEGDEDAELQLGIRLWIGSRYEEHDPEKGLGILEGLAKRGNSQAQSSLGFAYFLGVGVKQNRELSIKWLRMASENGSIYASTLLGEMLIANGNDSAKDASEGFELLMQSAQKNDPWAQYLLGYAYAMGLGAKKDEFSAANWYKKSAETGSVSAMRALAQLYADEGSGVFDLKESLNWYEKAANLDDMNALHQTGVYYLNGMGTDANSDLAILYLTRAAEKGSVGSQYTLGFMYYAGVAVEQSYEKAAELFKQAAGDGLALPEYWMGVMYENGQGVSQSYSVAFEYYNEAASLGHEQAMVKVANATAFGQGIDSDPEKAVELFRELAKQGNTEAMMFLVSAYETGFGVQKSEEFANYWKLRATEGGEKKVFD
jgi:TPR repeat protein